MLNTSDILSTLQMIDSQKLDVRTITMGISLLDLCAHPDDEQKLYTRTCTTASPHRRRIWSKPADATRARIRRADRATSASR